MATYAQIVNVLEDEGLARSVRAAVMVAADTVRAEVSSTPNHANRLAWARSVMISPESSSLAMLRAVVMQKRAETAGAIRGLSDTDVQTAVDAAVDLFAG